MNPGGGYLKKFVRWTASQATKEKKREVKICKLKC